METKKVLYEQWVEDGELTGKLLLIEGWAREGATDEMIAERLGIAVSTLYNYKRNYPQFRNAIVKGKEVVDYAVENALLGKALNGDVTAQIFWLKNRKREKWKDRYDADVDIDATERVIIVDDVYKADEMKNGSVN